MSRRQQSLLVVSCCRMLHTLETGRVTSKPEAGRWALGALDPRWRSLIRRALEDRRDQWGQVHQRPDERTVEHTLAFVDYVLADLTGA